ncbi:methyltransferase domain-containing protein, partial [Methylobacterium sp. WL7]|uniref:methyltransferase domain-containing protein n=1 Tax=Methylobacterium sp. WL7 TaxID=2603900 RepID=UPI0011C89F11
MRMIKDFWLRLVSKPNSRISRRERILRLIEPKGKRGIEIGALNRPIVTRADGEVLYADHLSTEGLRHKYANDTSVNYDSFNDLVEVDIVTCGQALSKVLKDGEKFQYVVASHVLEHIGDPIGWLIECTEILNDNGIIFLALPDRRFTFDRFRADTTTGELIANYHSKVTDPTPAQIFEYVARSVQCEAKDVMKLWRGKCDESAGINESKLREALRLEIDVTCNKTYMDAHCSVFTPYSFG